MPEPIRWGIFGTGSVAANFAEGLRVLPDAELFAVGSRTQAAADGFARRHRAAHAYGSYERLARDPRVDVVYIATPNVAHKEHALLCFEHGKAVVCEKPFAMNAAETKEIIAAKEAGGLFCMEAMWMRFIPAVRELSRLVRDGAIGDVRMVSAHLGMAFHFNPEHRVFAKSLGGGALLDLGVYPLSLAFLMLGRPTRIATQAVHGATGVDEQATILLEFPAGRQAVISTSLRHRTSNDATIMGTDGMIHLHEPLYRPESLTVVKTSKLGSPSAPRSGVFGRLKELPIARRAWDYYTRSKRKTVSLPVLGNGYAHEAIEAMRCLRAGETESPMMRLDETLAIMQTMDAIRDLWERAPECA